MPSTTFSTATPPEKTLLWLGYCGLIPFVALAMLMWAIPDERVTVGTRALVAYAAVIVSFLGGIHWGLGFLSGQARDVTGKPASPLFHFVWGIVPSLLAWLALMLPPSVALPSLALVLLVCFAVDRHTFPGLGLSRWLRLRLHLTLVAALSCLLGAAAL